MLRVAELREERAEASETINAAKVAEDAELLTRLERQASHMAKEELRLENAKLAAQRLAVHDSRSQNATAAAAPSRPARNRGMPDWLRKLATEVGSITTCAAVRDKRRR